MRNKNCVDKVRWEKLWESDNVDDNETKQWYKLNNQDDEINQIKETAKETTYKTDGISDGWENQHYDYH